MKKEIYYGMRKMYATHGLGNSIWIEQDGKYSIWGLLCLTYQKMTKRGEFRKSKIGLYFHCFQDGHESHGSIPYPVQVWSGLIYDDLNSCRQINEIEELYKTGEHDKMWKYIKSLIDT